MKRLPFAYVSKQLDSLYEKKFDLNDEAAINKHCEFIQAFIDSCGWETDDYIRVMMGFETETLTN